MTGRNLCDADFTGAHLVECRLVGTKLDNASFFGADMQGSNFTDASLRRADLLRRLLPRGIDFGRALLLRHPGALFVDGRCRIGRGVLPDIARLRLRALEQRARARSH